MSDFNKSDTASWDAGQVRREQPQRSAPPNRRRRRRKRRRMNPFLFILLHLTFVALAAFLIPLWLVFSAEDDLRTYEEMGSIITPEELEAKRRELGLRRPAGK